MGGGPEEPDGSGAGVERIEIGVGVRACIGVTGGLLLAVPSFLAVVVEGGGGVACVVRVRPWDRERATVPPRASPSLTGGPTGPISHGP